MWGVARKGNWGWAMEGPECQEEGRKLENVASSLHQVCAFRGKKKSLYRSWQETPGRGHQLLLT